MTTFVEMFHPLIPATSAEPRLVPAQAADDYEARGWLLVDPAAVVPDSALPYATVALVASQAGTSGTPIGNALRAAYVPKWKPNTAYAAGDPVVNPSGQLVTANTSFTSGASYVAGNWTVTAGGGGGGSTTDASLLTSGTLAAARIADGSLSIAKLAVDIATQAELDAVAAAVPEQARDALGAALVAGTGIAKTVDDAGDTITLTATGSGLTPLTTVAAATGAQNLALPTHGDSAFDLTLTGNVTITPSGGTAGEFATMTVILRQDATAGRVPTFAAKVAWPGQVAPVFNGSAGKYDVVQLTTLDGGTTFFGALVASAVQPVGVPAAPVSLAASPGSTQVVLNWADAGNGGSTITGHKVYRGTASGAETLLATLGAVSTYTDTGRTDGTTYYYKVTAINALGESVQSAEVASTPGHYLNVTTGGASTPAIAGMDAGAGTIDVRALVQMANWVPSANNFVVSQWGSVAANNRFALYVDNAGRLNGAWHNAAGVFQGLPSTVATNIPANGTKWIRALMNPTAGTCTYYLSDDGVTWTQLGTTITGLTTTGVQTGGTAYALTAGQTASATGQFAGRIYKAQMLVAAAEKAAVNYLIATPGAATVVGSQGETWTTLSPAAVV